MILVNIVSYVIVSCLTVKSLLNYIVVYFFFSFYLGFCRTDQRTGGRRQQLWDFKQHTLVGENAGRQSSVLNVCGSFCLLTLNLSILFFFKLILKVSYLNSNWRNMKALGSFLNSLIYMLWLCVWLSLK